jgi:hypothetical protein
MRIAVTPGWRPGQETRARSAGSKTEREKVRAKKEEGRQEGTETRRRTDTSGECRVESEEEEFRKRADSRRSSAA